MLHSLNIGIKPEPSPSSSDSMDIPGTSVLTDEQRELFDDFSRLACSDGEASTPLAEASLSTPPAPATSSEDSDLSPPAAITTSQEAPTDPAPSPAKPSEDEPFSIRLTPFIDHSSNTPAFYISSVERKTHEDMVIKIGRYTEKKESPPPKPEHAPIVFKSKVVSRTHAQLNVRSGTWFVQDVGSSSGTFLNQHRLSPACQSSKPVALEDGDVLQLGVDFRGGSEEIYKCIKVRIELNRSWQKRANTFKWVLLVYYSWLFIVDLFC